MPSKPRAGSAAKSAAQAAAGPPAGGPAPPLAQQQPAAEPAARVLRRFRSVFNAVKTHFQQVEKQAGVGGAQLWALSVIQSRPGIGVGGLALAMDIHQTTASNLVKAMVASALVSARRDGPDRRTTQLQLTAAGTRVLKKAPGPFAGVLPQALAALDARTLARLDRDLGKLLDKLQADAAAAQIPLAQM
jgi:DNA-binding MarR family transcriptional regulator